MTLTGNLRKMPTTLGEKAEYSLALYDVLTPAHQLPLNELVGHEISIKFTGAIHCVVTGKRIKKAYGEGMSYDAFMQSPMAVESIIRPELSRIHEGIALRDMEWEIAHHLQPHTVYLSLTAGVKVGVTRDTQIPTRWIDQGAVAAIPIARTPYRQAAGLIEVALKSHFADKTAWQQMLKNQVDESIDLKAESEKAISLLPEELSTYGSPDESITHIAYPVLAYPPKVSSLKLDKVPQINKTLSGIKGQYLLFSDGSALNVRAHTGYEVVVAI